MAHHHRAGTDAGVGAEVIAPSTLAPAPTTTFSASVGWRLPCSLPVPPRVTSDTAGNDLGRLPDHHTHPVVDEHAMADTGAWVDLNTSEAAADL